MKTKGFLNVKGTDCGILKYNKNTLFVIALTITG